MQKTIEVKSQKNFLIGQFHFLHECVKLKLVFYDYIYALVFISTARYENQVRRGKHHDGKIYFRQKPRQNKKF